MNDINLLNSQEIKNNGKKKEPVIMVMILPLGMVIIALALYSFLHFKTLHIEKQYNEINEKISQISYIEDKNQKVNLCRKKVESMTDILKIASMNSIINTKLFQILSSIMPNDVFIVNYDLIENGQVQFIGNSKSYRSIALFIYNLRHIDMFKEVNIISIQKELKPENDKSFYSFIIETEIVIN